MKRTILKEKKTQTIIIHLKNVSHDISVVFTFNYEPKPTKNVSVSQEKEKIRAKNMILFFLVKKIIRHPIEELWSENKHGTFFFFFCWKKDKHFLRRVVFFFSLISETNARKKGIWRCWMVMIMMKNQCFALRNNNADKYFFRFFFFQFSGNGFQMFILFLSLRFRQCVKWFSFNELSFFFFVSFVNSKKFIYLPSKAKPFRQTQIEIIIIELWLWTFFFLIQERLEYLMKMIINGDFDLIYC